MIARLDKHGIRINPTKCILGEEQIKFLGYVVLAKGTSTKSESDKKLSKANHDQTTTAIPGNDNFYRRFIPGAIQT